jgi:membrane-associated phospholipid phosphatase
MSDGAGSSTRAARRVILAIATWVVAFALAAALDATVAQWLRDRGVDQFLREHKALRETLKVPGFFAFTVVVAGIVAVVHKTQWRGALFFLAACATASVNQLLKWSVGRYRPFTSPNGSGPLAPFALHPFSHSGKNLCFPSGHACLAFATAAALGMLWPRWRWAFYPLAAVVAAERVAENAHWLSDAVAAAAIGVGGACVVRYFLGPMPLGIRPSQGDRTRDDEDALVTSGS